ncbi:malate synthase A [Eilatimonas milleporae]|uniref:Malate synthase n=1 Tax=Eilatimonas milleporae TaxID=911205 RepID=A0A3M0CHJ5_9PROT|nr:malate synthase A [Eilatimonas milleporae]RMB08000.1 malate synthase [Eilatimonas milleporae]
MTHNIAGLRIDAPHVAGQDSILTDEAMALVAGIEQRFAARRRDLVKARDAVQAKLDAGGTLDFLPETADIRAGDWTVAPTPDDLRDRRVEITGPVDRKMVINALNAGTKCFMADFEDSSTPTWANQIEGQINLRDAVARTISFHDAAKGKDYRLGETPAVLLVRPRGLHMDEAHVTLDGQPVSGGFLDFALYLVHNHAELKKRDSGPYFYLPKMEHHLEARLWEEVITFAETTLGLTRGTVRVTVLIETITAAFQMDEILYELKDHIVGLNCGRWDYIFNFIKRFARRGDMVLPDRDAVGMTQHFLRSYSLLLIKTCHRRGAHAMGGMAAQIPIKTDEAANKAAFDKVRADKEREASDGHDGTWVAHPGLVPVALAEFDKHMPNANQIATRRADVSVTADDLLKLPTGTITETGLRRNITIGLMYLGAWLGGTGCVPIFNLMEDAATAEISRTQLWQWRVHRAQLDDGRVIDDGLMRRMLDEEYDALRNSAGHLPRLEDAITLFDRLVMADDLAEFLTTDAYAMILEYEKTAA